MKIHHFSDIHEGAFPGPLAILSKRFFGGFNYCFLRKKHVQWQCLERAIEQIKKDKPEIVVISGDFTSTGSTKEFSMARKRLEPLRAIEDLIILAVPGNHDNYIDDKKSYKAMMEFIVWLTAGVVTEFPCRIEVPEAVFYLSDHSKPRPIKLSSGELTEETYLKLKEWSALDKGKVRVAIGHYPFLNDLGNELPARKSLDNGKKALSLLQSGDLEVNLCGHIHRGFLRTEDSGAIEVCAGSLTMGGQVNELEIVENKVEQNWIEMKSGFPC